MQNQTDATKWEEFLPWIENLENERSNYKNLSDRYVSQLVFRGHSSEKWQLETTLERYSGHPLRVDSHYDKAYEAKNLIETYTQQEWKIPTPAEYRDLLDSKIAFGWFELPAYDYLVYLRHHGFPSPLLDWAASPYIAAHFACSGDLKSNDRIALYALLEYAGNGKTSSHQQPTVHGAGPNVRSHRRHFLQQSQYTMCLEKRGDHLFYASHEAALTANQENSQDLLWKFTLPASECVRVLKSLDKFNLNAYSLFGSEESLMQTMAMRLLSP